MDIHLRVGNRIWEVGKADFLHAFFSTVSYHLEPGGWGSRFPKLMHELHKGKLEAPSVDEALRELETVRIELVKYPSTDVIWDIENRAAAPPWGNNISLEITDLSNYFVTSDGRDLISVIAMALQRLKKAGGALTVQ